MARYVFFDDINSTQFTCFIAATRLRYGWYSLHNKLTIKWWVYVSKRIL